MLDRFLAFCGRAYGHWCAIKARWIYAVVLLLLSVIFASSLALQADIPRKLQLHKPMLPIRSTRSLTKRDMLHNDACPQIEVNSQTHDVYADGELLTCEPATVVPLAQRYFLR